MSAALKLPAGRPLRVLFVCTGNICRSPTAEGIARHMAVAQGLDGKVEFDSVGTHGYHVGEAPDRRSQEFAARRGYDLSPLRARKLQAADFVHFDLLLAMDHGHMEQMQQLCPPQYRSRLGMFMTHASASACDEVPDPYYGGADGFDRVLDCCEDAVGGLLRGLVAEVR